MIMKKLKHNTMLAVFVKNITYAKNVEKLNAKGGNDMADTELVIKLPEEMYNDIHDFCGMSMVDAKEALPTILNSIHNGTPFPKKHGKLIDADKIGLTDFEILMCDGNYKEALRMIIDKINNASPIIESVKAESENKE